MAKGPTAAEVLLLALPAFPALERLKKNYIFFALLFFNGRFYKNRIGEKYGRTFTTEEAIDLILSGKQGAFNPLLLECLHTRRL